MSPLLQLEAERASMQSAAASALYSSERQWSHREATLVKDLDFLRKELEMTREALSSQTEQGLARETHIISLETARTTLMEELNQAREEVHDSIRPP